MGRTNDADQPGDSELLPGWSSLVILLAIFVSLSIITLLTIVRSDDEHAVHGGGGTRAFGPADFPQVDFDEPLLAAVQDAAQDEQGGTFHVPPAPFSDEDVFPCTACHADLEVDYEPRTLEMYHAEVRLDHGPEERWCFDCHNAEDRDRLRLANGTLVGFDESYRLCGQCHGTIYRDWRSGIHGRRRGFWNGSKSYLLCAHCHNPHAPRFEALEPLAPPVRPQFLRSAAEPAS